jgi:hypothetical protein
MSVDAQRAVPAGRKAAVLASDLEKPDLDNRSYRVIQLPNKLEALLVHDPDTDKASAALDVHVGNFSDGSDLQVSCSPFQNQRWRCPNEMKGALQDRVSDSCGWHQTGHLHRDPIGDVLA